MSLIALTPLAAIVVFDVLYQIFARKLSAGANPLASLGFIYLFSAAICAVLFEIIVPDGHIIDELAAFNMGAVIIGIAVALIEAGTLYMYKAGWSISMSFIVYTALASATLIVIGVLCFDEALTWQKGAGLILSALGIGCMTIGKKG